MPHKPLCKEKAQANYHITDGFSTTLTTLWSSLRLWRMLLKLLFALLAFGLRC